MHTSEQGGVVRDPEKVVNVGLPGRMSYTADEKESEVSSTPMPRTSQRFWSCDQA